MFEKCEQKKELYEIGKSMCRLGWNPPQVDDLTKSTIRYTTNVKLNKKIWSSEIRKRCRAREMRSEGVENINSEMIVILSERTLIYQYESNSNFS